MIQRRSDLAGIDDLVAELAFARRALLRHLADDSLCRRRFTHPRRPTEFDAVGHLMVDACACIRATGHDRGCLCAHGMERVVYRVDDDGREHYSTLPLETRR